MRIINLIQEECIDETNLKEEWQVQVNNLYYLSEE